MGLTAYIVATQREGAQLTCTQRVLATLRESGAQIVVSGADLDPQSAALPAITGILWATCASRDRLAAYAAGVRALDRCSPWERIVLLDDSFVSLNPEHLVETLNAATAFDVASLTMVSDPLPCLHANWIDFRGHRALQRSSFFDWWGQAATVSEQTLTGHCAAAGLRVGANFRPDRAQCILAMCRALVWGALPMDVPGSGSYCANPDVALGLDPRVFLWDELMARYGVLFAQLCNPAVRMNLEPLRLWLAANPAAARIVNEAMGVLE